MGRPPTPARVARWEVEAIDLTATPAKSADYLTKEQLSDEIGLAVGTIMDSITRAPITRADKPRSAICRPAARIGRVPLWSKKQRDLFLRLREEQEDAADVIKELEAVTAEQAEERGLYSIIQYAGMFKLHDQTLRRAQSHDGNFPPAVAKLRKDTPGVPEHLFELDPMIDWMHGKGYQIPPGLLAAQS